MSEIIIDAALLKRMVGSTAPAAARPADVSNNPCLAAVRLRTADGRLLVEATDRYLLVQVSTDAAGVLEALVDAAALGKAVRAIKVPRPVGDLVGVTTLEVIDGRLVIKYGVGHLEDGLLEVQGVIELPLVPEGTYAAFPSRGAVATIIPADVDLESAPAQLIALKPSLVLTLATCLKAAAGRDDVHAATFRVPVQQGPKDGRSATKPVRVELEVDGLRLVAAVMPVRIPAEEADHVG